MHFVGEVAARVRGKMRRLLSVDDAVQHERVEREEPAAFDDFVVRVSVAVSDPALAVGSNSGKVGVVAATPDGVGIEEPEGRGIGSGREIDKQVGLQPTKVADEVKRCVEVATERTS